MAAITKLCNQSYLMKSGKLYATGRPEEIVGRYLEDEVTRSNEVLLTRLDRKGSGIAKFRSIDLCDSEGRTTQNVICGQEVLFLIRIHSDTSELRLRNMVIGIGIDDAHGQRVWHISNESSGDAIDEITAAADVIEILIPKLPLVQGRYTATLFISSNGEIIDWLQNAFTFNVESGDFYGTGKLPPIGQGIFLANHYVKIKKYSR